MDGLANRLFIARDLIYHKPRPVSAADFTPLSRSPIQTFRILYHDADGVGGEVLWDGEKAEIIASPENHDSTFTYFGGRTSFAPLQ